jgi:hypothetical protein
MRGVVAGGALALVVAVTPALACEGNVVLLHGTFGEKVSSIWQSTTDVGTVGGALQFDARVDKAEKLIAGPLYTDVDVCADVIVVDTPDLAAAYAGIGFWMTDTRNLYTFQLTPDGYAGVYRLKDDSWTTVIKDKPSSAIASGTGAVNTLRVVAVGDKADLYINGELFDSIEGEAPSGGSHIGFVVEGPSGKVATFRFNDIDATYPE